MYRFGVVFISLVLFAMSFAMVLALRVTQVHVVATPAPTFVPQKVDYKLEPPSQSLTGTLQDVEGKVQKLPRDADDVVDAENDMTILEGEQLTAGETGSVTVKFPTELSLTVYPQTTVAISSSDPAHFLTSQIDGKVTYTTDDTTKQISVRSLDALMSITEGSATVVTNSDKERITLTVDKGTGELGFIGRGNKTQTTKVQAGETATYDNKKLTVKVK